MATMTGYATIKEY